MSCPLKVYLYHYVKLTLYLNNFLSLSEIISDIIVYFCKTPAFTNFSFKMATSTILER
jgi:hypothetical protein